MDCETGETQDWISIPKTQYEIMPNAYREQNCAILLNSSIMLCFFPANDQTLFLGYDLATKLQVIYFYLPYVVSAILPDLDSPDYLWAVSVIPLNLLSTAQIHRIHLTNQSSVWICNLTSNYYAHASPSAPFGAFIQDPATHTIYIESQTLFMNFPVWSVIEPSGGGKNSFHSGRSVMFSNGKMQNVFHKQVRPREWAYYGMGTLWNDSMVLAVIDPETAWISPIGTSFNATQFNIGKMAAVDEEGQSLYVLSSMLNIGANRKQSVGRVDLQTGELVPIRDLSDFCVYVGGNVLVNPDCYSCLLFHRLP